MDLLLPQFSLLALIAAAAGGYAVGRFMRPDPRRAAEQARVVKAAADKLDRGYRSLDEDKRRDVERLIKNGKLIEAIRDVRLALGCGLREAKELVERLPR